MMVISRKNGKVHAAMAVCFGADRVEHETVAVQGRRVELAERP
jgi:hypothetical protein